MPPEPAKNLALQTSRCALVIASIPWAYAGSSRHLGLGFRTKSCMALNTYSLGVVVVECTWVMQDFVDEEYAGNMQCQVGVRASTNC